MRALRLQPRSALAIYAHPDDADVAAGGLLAQWAAEGAEIHLVVVCDGAKGSHSPNSKASDVRETRREELQFAADLLGARSVTSLDWPDGEVTNSVELRETLVGLVRKYQPDVVLGPDPTATFFGGVYVNHRDHRETGWALLDAVAPAAAMPLYFPSQGPPHQVSVLLLSGTHEPDVVADVSRTIDMKVKAILAHASQLAGDAVAIRDVVLERAEQAGRPVGMAYGEAFRCVELDF
ncbi:MAG TPA: PIG-L deacetylase family protein [Acidimicrobiales bacterium]|nr:PIG-L deacetylase family protein [Acidimicrobiales bacterium]